MRVAVLGSGSHGNAVALTRKGATVLVDAGFGIRSLARRAGAAGIDLDRLDAVVLTHEHGDHARGAVRVARRAGCPVFATSGTLHALGARMDGVPTHVLPGHGVVTVGPFSLRTSRTSHDAAEPIALSVGSAGGGGPWVGIAYDLGTVTAAVRSLLRDASCLIVEANHDGVMLRTGPYPAAVRERIGGHGGHLSNRACAALVAELCHAGLATVVLAHVSDQCNRSDLALAVVRAALARRRYRGDILVARQDAPLPPFDLGAAGQLTLEMT